MASSQLDIPLSEPPSTQGEPLETPRPEPLPPGVSLERYCPSEPSHPSSLHTKDLLARVSMRGMLIDLTIESIWWLACESDCRPWKWEISVLDVRCCHFQVLVRINERGGLEELTRHKLVHLRTSLIQAVMASSLMRLSFTTQPPD